MSSSESAEDEDAVRALFWESLRADGVAAGILMRTCADILVIEPDDK